jgi:hypothetical protein
MHMHMRHVRRGSATGTRRGRVVGAYGLSVGMQKERGKTQLWGANMQPTWCVTAASYAC